VEADFDRTPRLKERLDRLLREAAEVEVELSRTEGAIKGVPHSWAIERRAHELGKPLSRQVQQREMSELAASQAVTAQCADCGTRVPLHCRSRKVTSVDGETPLQELVGDSDRGDARNDAAERGNRFETTAVRNEWGAAVGAYIRQ